MTHAKPDPLLVTSWDLHSRVFALENEHRQAFQTRVEYHTKLTLLLYVAMGAGVWQADTRAEYLMISGVAAIAGLFAFVTPLMLDRVYWYYREFMWARERLEVAMGLREKSQGRLCVSNRLQANWLRKSPLSIQAIDDDTADGIIQAVQQEVDRSNRQNLKQRIESEIRGDLECIFRIPQSVQEGQGEVEPRGKSADRVEKILALPVHIVDSVLMACFPSLKRRHGYWWWTQRIFTVLGVASFVVSGVLAYLGFVVPTADAEPTNSSYEHATLGEVGPFSLGETCFRDAERINQVDVILDEIRRKDVRRLQIVGSVDKTRIKADSKLLRTNVELAKARARCVAGWLIDRDPDGLEGFVLRLQQTDGDFSGDENSRLVRVTGLLTASDAGNE